MKRSLALAVPMLMAASPSVASSVVSEPVLPEWMAGCWLSENGSRWTEECWMPPRGGMMLGTGRSGVGDRVTEWEAMRIETAVGDVATGATPRMAYRASPQGEGWTTFAWSPSEGQGVTFFNAAHDYPQRIRYWRDGAMLMAEISLRDGSRARRWTYKPAQQ